jgi:glycosyltransferase involved in cell wall biosynthesis
VYFVHGFPFQTEFWRLRDAPWYVIERALAPITDHFQVMNRADEALVERWKKSVTFVPGVGVDLDRVRFEGDRGQAEVELRLEPARVRALFIGELSRRKGISLLAACAQDAPDIRWLVVGDGPLHTELVGLPNVDILGRRESIAAPLAACDVFVSFAVREGLPLAVQEAAAAGLPVVAVPNRGTLELARAGVVTALVAARPEAILIEVRRLAEHGRREPRVYARRPDVAVGLVDDLLSTR